MSSPPKSPSSPSSRSPKVGKLIDTIRNSPAFIRKHMHGHREDSSGKGDASPVFYAQYMGKEEVSNLRFRHCNDVVDHLIGTAKSDPGKKLRKCTIRVRKLSIDIELSHSKECTQIPLHNIAYCAADMKFPKVFTFIAKDNEQNGNLVCYAFLCNKQEKARAMTLCLSKAFETAFLEWQQSKQRTSRLSHIHNHGASASSHRAKPAGRPADGACCNPETTVPATEDAGDSSEEESDVLSPEEEANMHREFTRRESTMRKPSLLPLGNILEELENDETVSELVAGDTTPNHGDVLDLHI